MIWLPVNLLLTVQDREPRQATVCTDSVIDKSILPIAPGPEHHGNLRICIDDGMGPARWYDDLLTRSGRYRKTTPGIILSAFLRIDDRAAFPYLE
jgi:hypothetical protein